MQTNNDRTTQVVPLIASTFNFLYSKGFDLNVKSLLIKKIIVAFYCNITSQTSSTAEVIS